MKPVLFIFPIFAAALWQPLSAETWTYADCVEYAREHNIQLQKARLNELTAGYNLEEAEGTWQPTLDFATSHSLSNSPWGKGNKNSYSGNYGLNASWTVWNGGIRENTISKDRLQLERSKITAGSMFRSLETDLLQVYINLLYARESIGICESASALSEKQAERARQLMEAGKVSRVDYAQLQSQAEQDKYNVVNSVATYDTRCQELKKLLQLGLDSEVTPATVDWTDAQVLEALPPMAESFEMARAIDLDIQGLQLDSRAAEYDVKIARAGRMPKISLNAGVSTGTYSPGDAFFNGLKNGLNEQVGVSVSVPIFDGRKTKSATARANVARQEAELNISDREVELQHLIENWYTDTSSAQARYKAALSQLESAALTDELTSERFSLGYINPVELLTAHNALTEARHAVLQAKCMAMLGQKMIGYYRTATVDIH